MAIRYYVPKHIKYVFVFRPNILKGKTDMFYYFVALATDDNEIYFERYQIRNEKKNFLKSMEFYLTMRMQKFMRFFWTYNIDDETEILFSTYEKFYKKNDFFYEMFRLFAGLFRFRLNRRKIEEIFLAVRKFHKFDPKCFYPTPKWKGERKRFQLFTRNANICFKGMMQNRICPWINPEMELFLDKQSDRSKQIYKFCTFGLWFMVIRNYLKVKQGFDLTRWYYHIEIDMSDFTKFMKEQQETAKISENATKDKENNPGGLEFEEEDEEEDMEDDVNV